MLEFKIFEKFDHECCRDFEKLNNNSNYNFFQNFNYLKNLSFENKNKIKIVSIYSKKNIIAILPLEIKKYFVFKVLQWIGTEKSDVCNPILIKNFELYVKDNNFLSLWEDILKSIGEYDLIFFNNQISKIGDSSNPFTKYLKSVRYSNIYQIKLPENFQEYLDNQKKNDKKKYYEIHRTRIKSQNLNEKHNVLFEIKKLSDLNLTFEDVIKDKIKQLKKKKIRHNLDQKFIKIFDTLIKKNASNYVLASLKIEKQIISSCFGILLNDTFYYYIPFMSSTEYNKFKPGKILTLKIISWCIENKIKIFDFGLGDEKYKENFSNYSLPLYRFAQGKSLLGKFLLLGIKIIFFNKKL